MNNTIIHLVAKKLTFNCIVRMHEYESLKKRIRKLWQEFSSLEEIQGLKKKDIREKTGFPDKLCEAILKRSADNKS